VTVDGYWIVNWIYYSQYSYSVLHFTPHSNWVSSGTVRVTPLSNTHTPNTLSRLHWTHNYIDRERTTKRTPPTDSSIVAWDAYCCMTSLPEQTAKKTLVASIVALHGNGCKQASYCWLLTYSVHVTILCVIWIRLLHSIEKFLNIYICLRNGFGNTWYGENCWERTWVLTSLLLFKTEFT
jgi:hypothetical protein